MKLLFDQNISFRILAKLSQEFAGSVHVKTEGLIDASDIEVWNFAKAKGFIIVTQDSDFNDLTSLYGFPPKIIWIRFGNLRTEEIADLLKFNLNSIEKFSTDPDLGCFEMIRLTQK